MIVNSNPEAAKIAQETYKKIYKEGARSVMGAASNVARPRNAKGQFVKGSSLHVEGEAQLPGAAQPAKPAQPANISESVAAAKARANSGKAVSEDTVNDILEMMLEDFR